MTCKNINIDGSVLPVQVIEGNGLEPTNLGNEKNHWTMPLKLRLHNMKLASIMLLQTSTQAYKQMSNRY